MKKNYTDLYITIASLTRRLSLSALLALSFSSPGFGQVKSAEIIGTPVLENERVTVRIKAKDGNDRPVLGLQETDFNLIVDNKPLEFRSKDWKSPEEAVPPPAWIIVLLDFSGSMNNKDSRGTTRKAGSIDAIKQFTTELANRCPKNSTVACPKPQVSIIPFGDGGPSCEKGFPVTPDKLNNFMSAGDYKLASYLNDYLPKEIACASTNIYEPLSKAVRFLADPSSNPGFYVPKDSNEPQPRLSIIVLSDGYHNKANRDKDFNSLLSLLKKNDQITIHTLGYGLTPAELGKKYNLGRAAKISDVGKGDRKVPEDDFVDQESLAAIAKATGGIAEFSPDSQTVTDKLKLFLNALLGEYQISYNQPNAERGSKHDVQVVVQSVKSVPASYTITVFGRSLPLNTRMTMLLAVLVVIAVGGVLPFWLWAEYLKREAQA